MVSLDDGILLYGGQTGPPPDGAFLHDTWTYRMAGGWHHLASCPAPPWGTATAFDSESHRVILFGTVVSDQPQGPRAEVAQTWSFDPVAERWTNMLPSEGPTDLFAPVMAYDSASDRVILFGGNNTVGQPGATWAYDVNANAWTQMQRALQPPQRAFGHMAYDAQSDAVILFGGGNDPQDFGDTWAYDVDADTWTEMSPSTGPVPMSYAAMAYDPASDRVILFGGAPSANGERPLGETWSYDVEANTWTLLEAGASPPPRGWHGLALDPGSGRLVLFGGGVDRDHYLSDTWIFDPRIGEWSE